MCCCLALAWAGAAYANSEPVVSDKDAAIVQANKERAAAKALREEAQAIREKEDYKCRQSAFFVNNCLANARDRYIKKIEPARAMEIEANRLETDARTRALIERNVSAEKNPPKPGGTPTSKDKNDKRTTPTGNPISEDGTVTPKPTAKPIDPIEQSAREKQKQQERQSEAQRAAERAEKARKDKAAYEQRAEEAAKRKADREAQQAKKEAEKAAKDAKAKSAAKENRPFM